MTSWASNPTRAGAWTVQDAVKAASVESAQPSQDLTNKCDRFTGALVWGFGGSGYASAYVHWQSIPAGNKRGPSGTPRSGAALFWQLGEYGHTALVDTDPAWCWSNDYVRRGKIDRVRVADITRGWGAKLLGWSDPAYIANAYGTSSIKWRPSPTPTPPVPIPPPVLADLSGEDMLINAAGAWWLLSGGSIASIDSQTASNAKASGVPAFAATPAAWSDITRAYGTPPPRP